MSEPRLPEWADPLYEAEEMRAVDAWAIDEQRIPSLRLMERAGEGLARVVAAVANEGPIRVLVGKGNNGGDGLVVARLLREEGREVDVLSLADLSEASGDPAANLDSLPGDAPRPFEGSGALEGSGAIVDAMLGTGFSGEPREPIAGAIEAINATGCPVIACDVPSGVDASTGRVEGAAVRATVTATFHGAKVGLHVMPGAEHAGGVEVIDIGVPRGAPEPVRAGLIADRILDGYPRRGRHGSKFDSGVVVIAGGSKGLTGAPTMAALSAQRSGAGYIQVAVPSSAQQAMELRLLEGMSRGLPEEDGAHCERGLQALLEMSERAGAVVIGPGLGRAETTQAFARAATRRIEAPVVLDADGLNAHAGDLDAIGDRSRPIVLTPHEAELARLLDTTPGAVAADRLGSVRSAARTARCVVVLKGDDTLVCRPDGMVAVSPGATPALATAGTGDVLSGVVGCLLAKGLDPFEAAAMAVRGHARAGIEAARRHGADHVIAGDVIEALPAGLHR